MADYPSTSTHCAPAQRSAAPGVRGVPRLIHQTWPTSNLSTYCDGLGDLSSTSWRAAYPQWRYVLWTDQKLLGLLALPKYRKYHATWVNLGQGGPLRAAHIMRIDFLRYLLLLEHGGIYADLDFIAKAPIPDAYLRTGLVLYKTPRRNRTWTVGQAFLAVAPHHPVLHALVESIHRCALASQLAFLGRPPPVGHNPAACSRIGADKPLGALHITGPEALTRQMSRMPQYHFVGPCALHAPVYATRTCQHGRYVLLGENAMGSEVTGSHGQFANHMQKRQWLNGLHAFHGCSGRRPASPVQRCAQLHSMTNISRLLAQQQCRGGGRDEKASLCKNHFVVDGTSTNGTALQFCSWVVTEGQQQRSECRPKGMNILCPTLRLAL